MSEAISAQGTIFEVDLDGGSPAVYATRIREVRSIGGPSETSDEIDVTSLDSTGGRREYLQSFKDADDIPMEINYRPGDTDQAALLALYDTGVVAGGRITYPDLATYEFDFFVKGRSRPAQVGDALVITVTLRQTGAGVFTASA